jgi:hypothetical protein
VSEDGLDDVAHLEVVRVPLVEIDVPAGDRRLIEVPHQHAVARFQLLETVRIELHDGGLADALEEVRSLVGPQRRLRACLAGHRDVCHGIWPASSTRSR